MDNSKFKLKKSIYKISTCITDILSQFISVQVLVFPIQIYYFSSFELLSPISNVLLYPLIYISFLFGFISLFLFLVPVISPLILTSTNLIFSFVIFITQKLAYLNISITIPRPRIWMIVLYYILVFLFLNDKKAIRYFKLNVAKNVRAIKYILTCVFVVLVSIYYTYVMFFEKYIYYFNVGQGNMALIHYNKKNILLDCGSTSNNVTYNLLSGFMKLKGIKNIDILVISHFHEDHMNLITSDKMDIQIDKIIYAKPKEEIETYDLVLNYAQKNNISFIETSIFEEYNYDNISMQIISPSSNTKIEDQDVQNANSVVTLITINNKNMLFMGDSTINTEEYIMQKIENMENTQDKENVLKKLNSIDIYQVGHHGSISSTSQKWLDYLNIKNAVISSKKQVYGHPSDEVLKRLMDKNITVYVTEKDKAIKFKL